MERYFVDRAKKRSARLARAAKLMPRSPHKSILLPYVTRIMAAKREGGRLTAAQDRIAKAFTGHVSADTVLNRFNNLPPNVGKAMDKKVFTLQRSSDVDRYVGEQLALAAESVASAIGRSRSDSYRMEGFHHVDFEGIGALKDWADYHQNPPDPEPCPNLYQLRLEYRGITTHRTADRSGGVEPYLITGVYRIPFRTVVGSIHSMTREAIVKQYPKDLHDMSAGYWMPQGGEQDQYGNPSDPFQFFPLITANRTVDVPGRGEMTFPVDGWVTPVDSAPVLIGRDMHCALISVWEQDGDQSAELLANMGAAMMAIGGLIPVPGVGAVIIVIGAALELASYITGEDDDPIGDRVLLLGEEHLQMTGMTERNFTVTSSDGDNRWTVYIGAESQKLVA
ncbi:MAG: hypothetical protein P8172_04590 [Gammaproteobacteria bacterium]